MLPDCFDCKSSGLKYPCRMANGSTLDLQAIAREFVQGAEQPRSEAARWASRCAIDIVSQTSDPSLALRFVIAAMNACATVEQARFVAAGPCEDLVDIHGPALIDLLEQLAGQSPKFRYILSGIWVDSLDVEVRARLGRVVARGGRMSDKPGHLGGVNPHTVLRDDEALQMLKGSIDTETL